jgi:hypothetical protein
VYKVQAQVSKTLSRSQPFCLQIGVLGDLKLSLHASDGTFFGFDQALYAGDLTTLDVDLEIGRESHDSFVPPDETADLVGGLSHRGQICRRKSMVGQRCP